MNETLTQITPADVVSRYDAYKVSLCGASRAAMTRASDLGHPCTAYIVFTRVAGEQASKPDATLAAIFAEGRLQEEGVKADLMKLGFRIDQSQQAIYWDKYAISGHIDGFLVSDDMKPVLIEIKSCSPFAFVKFNTVQDIISAKQYFYRKWIAQLQIYMLLESVPEAWLILKNKATGQLKIIAVTLDLEFAETLIKKAEEVQRGIHSHEVMGIVNDTCPRQDQFIPAEMMWDDWLKGNRLNDVKICTECPFKTLCCPEIDAGAGIGTITDPDMPDKIKRHQELDPLASEYDELHEEIKSEANRHFEAGHTNLICGDWYIVGQKVEPKGRKPFWKMEIVKI